MDLIYYMPNRVLLFLMENYREMLFSFLNVKIKVIFSSKNRLTYFCFY